MKKHKFISFGICIILIAGIIGCGKNESLNNDTTEVNQEEAEISEQNEPINQEESNRNKYIINLSLDTEKHILNEELEITFTNDSEDNWSEVVFRDYMNSALKETNLKSGITSVSTKDGELIFSKASEDGSIIKVALQEDLKPQDKLTLYIKYTTDIPDAASRSRCLYGDNCGGITYELAQCFPVMAIYENGDWICEPYFDSGECMYSKCSDYDVTITLPENWIVAASGEETFEKSNDGNNWTITAQNMRDFTLVASNVLSVETDTVNGITINSYYKSEDEKNKLQGDFSLEACKKAVSIYSETYGDYPYSELDVVESLNPVGGIESPGLIRIADFFSENLGADGGDADGRLVSDCVAHETAHEWFYAVVGNNQYKDAWLDEGLASYSEILFIRDAKWGSEFVDEKIGLCQRLYDEASTKDNYINKSYDELLEDYGITVYEHAEYFLYQLEQLMGENEFDEFMKAYYKKYSFKESDTKAFVDTLEPFISENSQAMELVKQYIVEKE